MLGIFVQEPSHKRANRRNLANIILFCFFPLRFGRKKVVVIGLVVAAIANLLVTVIPNDKENTGDEFEMVFVQNCLLSFS